MAKRGNGGRRRGASNGARPGQRRVRKIVVLVLPERTRGWHRWIEVAHVRYYFTLNAWLRGMITRKWITELFCNGVKGVPHWSDVPIRRDGVYVRTDEGVFYLPGVGSLKKVAGMVEGELLLANQSVLVNEQWIHDYFSVQRELSVRVERPDGSRCAERVQVSLRNKPRVEERLWAGGRERRRRRPAPDSQT